MKNHSRSLYDYEVNFRSRIVFFSNKGTRIIRRNLEKEKWRRLGEKRVLEASHVVCQGTFYLQQTMLETRKVEISETRSSMSAITVTYISHLHKIDQM